MNRKELERKLIEITQEKNKLENLISNNCLNRIEVIEQKNLLYIKDLKIQNLIEKNKFLRKRNQELIDEIAQLKYTKRKYTKKSNKINYKEYNVFRKQILERDNYTCQNCGCKDKLQVHHIKSRKQFPQLIMNKDNCITLCISCHAKTDNYFC